MNNVPVLLFNALSADLSGKTADLHLTLAEFPLQLRCCLWVCAVVLKARPGY